METLKSRRRSLTNKEKEPSRRIRRKSMVVQTDRESHSVDFNHHSKSVELINSSFSSISSKSSGKSSSYSSSFGDVEEKHSTEVEEEGEDNNEDENSYNDSFTN